MKLSLFATFTLILFLCGCKPVRIPKADTTTPKQYVDHQDETNIARINWREYFDDPHLIQLIDTAISGNYDLKKAILRIRIARAGVRATTGESYPQVEAALSMGVTRYSKYTEDHIGNVTTDDFDGNPLPHPIQDHFLGLTATWELDFWGKLKNQRKSAVSGYLATIEGKNFVHSNLVAEVASAYYSLVALDNELEILQQTIEKQKHALAVIEGQKEAAQTNILAVQQFRIQKLGTLAKEKETRHGIEEKENKINFLLGRFPQSIDRNKESLFRDLPKKVQTGVPSQLLANRPDIREAEHELRASRFDIKTARAAFFPSFTITANAGLQAFNPKYLIQPPSIGFSLLGGLVAPVINRKAIRAQYEAAKAAQLKAMYNYQSLILNGFMEVMNELTNIRNFGEIHAIKTEQSVIARDSIEASIELYQAGRANYLEVLMAQQNALEIQLEMLETVKKQRLAVINLYKALGGGWR